MCVALKLRCDPLQPSATRSTVARVEEVPAMPTQHIPASRLLAGVVGATRHLWHGISVGLYSALALLEPLVVGILFLLALLGVIVALLFRFLLQQPDFSFWPVLFTSLGCFVAALAYYGLMRLLEPRQ